MIRFLFALLIYTPSIFAYLDPSTGSLLLSSVVAIFASFVFFLKSIYYKICFLISGGKVRKDTNSYGLVFYSEGRQYYGVFRTILDKLDLWKYPYVFLTSDEKDPALLRGDKVRFIGSGNKAFAYLNMLSADVVVMTTPGLDVLQIKRSKKVFHYSHIVHSLGSPNYRIFGMDYYDSVLINSEFQKEFIREIELSHNIKHKEIFNIGSPYCDDLYEKKIAPPPIDVSLTCNYFQDSNQIVILLSPSWGKEAALAKFGMSLIQPILDCGFNLIIRPHPQSLISEESLIKDLQQQTKHSSQVVWDIGTPNIYAMQRCDVMISDFSGIIFDCLCLYQKPILTLEFDFDHAGYDSSDTGELWEFLVLDKIGKRISQKHFCDIGKIIKEILESDKSSKNLQNITKEIWSYPHKAGTIGAEVILKLHQKVLLEKMGDAKEYCKQYNQINQILNGGIAK